jgi:phospholipase/carboxylesterase
MLLREDEFGGLTVRITGGSDGQGGGDGPLVVLMHGFGAPGDDLVPLAPLLGLPRAVRFAFPAAPLELGGGYGDSRAWWMIDLERLEMDLASGRERDRSADDPAGLAEAREAVAAAVDQLQEELGAPPQRTVLGGFSQGAMLATDLALRGGRPLAGLLLWSGTLLAAETWRALAPERSGLPVFMSHGRQDALLPFAAAERLRELLAGAGLGVEWVPFRGGHEIPPPALQGAAAFLARLLG